MSSPSRVLFVAENAPLANQREGQGALDGQAFSERLRQRDAGFLAVQLHSESDQAEQIDEWFRAHSGAALGAAVMYVSARALRADGELLFSLDLSQPETVDAFADMLLELKEDAPGPCLAVLDLRCVAADDPLEPMELVKLARDAARAAGVEVLAAVRHASVEAETDPSLPSPFTRQLLLAIDDADPQGGVGAEALYTHARQHKDVLEAGYALVHASAVENAALLPPRRTSAGARAPEPIADPESHESDVSASEATPAPAPAMEQPAPAEVRSVPPPTPSARPSAPPVTLGTVLAEAAVAAQAGDEEGALGRYRKALALVGGESRERDRAEIYLLIAEAKLRQGQMREAISSYEKALGGSEGPSATGAARAEKALLTLYLGERDYRSVQQAQDRILARVTEPSEQVAALLAFASMWTSDGNDMLRGREMLERAVGLAPDHLGAHQGLLELAEREGRVDDVLVLKRRIPELMPLGRARAEALYQLAGELLTKHKREDEGLDVLEAGLESDPSFLEPLARLSALLAERQEWSELEGVYQRMIERLPRVADDALRRQIRTELGRRLGLLLREHLADPQAAREALLEAVVASPDVPLLRADLVELGKELDDGPLVIEQALAWSALEPEKPQPYHLLFEQFMRADAVSRALQAARVLLLLGSATERQRAFALAQDQDDAERPSAVLGAEAMQLLRAPLLPGSDTEETELIAGIIAASGDSLLAALSHLAELAGRKTGLDPKLAVDVESTTVSAARTLVWASRALGVACPQIYLEEASVEAMTPVLRPEVVTVVGAAALRGRSLQQLSFLAGYHLMLQAPSHRLVRLSPQIDDLAACFVTAVLVAVPDTPVPDRLKTMTELLLPATRERLAAERETELEEAVIAFDAAGARADLLSYARAVEAAGLRAGLLLCQKLEVAVQALDLLPPGHLNADERRRELMAFAVSEQAAELRSLLGYSD